MRAMARTLMDETNVRASTWLYRPAKTFTCYTWLSPRDDTGFASPYAEGMPSA
jgi:hypothetical protein